MANVSSKDISPTQAQTPKCPATDQTQSFQFFSRLPCEVRQLIWYMTFSPRTIQIKVHTASAPKDPTKRASICFTATEDFTGIRSTYAKFESIPSSDNNISGSFQGTLTLIPSPALSMPSPPGPIALQVCCESREVALRHYKPAFAGVKLLPDEDAEFDEAWRAAGTGEKRIWVDFKRDLIVILHHDNVSPTYISRGPNHPLYQMAKYALEETKEIERLGVSECWYTAAHPARAIIPSQSYPMNGITFFDNTTGFHRESAVNYLRRTLKDFKAIKDLEVYEIGGRPVPIYESRWLTVASNFLQEDMAAWKAKLVDVLQRDKEETPEWTADLPTITVRRGLHGHDNSWDGTFIT